MNEHSPSRAELEFQRGGFLFHVLKLTVYLLALTVWWLLPWLSDAGAMHSKIPFEKFAGWFLWAGFGIAVSWVFLRDWWVNLPSVPNSWRGYSSSPPTGTVEKILSEDCGEEK